MPNGPRSDQAEAAARILVEWHIKIGANEIGDKPAGEYDQQYLMLLNEFRHADLSEPAVQLRLADAQLGGLLEHFYHGDVPPELWHQYAVPGLPEFQKTYQFASYIRDRYSPAAHAQRAWAEPHRRPGYPISTQERLCIVQRGVERYRALNFPATNGVGVSIFSFPTPCP